jgi:hypothetical protein
MAQVFKEITSNHCITSIPDPLFGELTGEAK